MIVNPHVHTEQEILNSSFDEEFGVSSSEMLGYDSATQVLRRVAVDPDGQVKTVGAAPVGGATSAIQTDGSQKTQIVDAGGEAVTVTGGKLDVNISDATYSTSTVTQVASSATSVQLLASTAGRRGASFFNDSTAIAYLKLGTTAATNSYTVKMAAGSFYELPQPCYTGRIDCIWASANGVMAISELS